PPDGLEHNFERRRVHWLENSIFKTSLLTVDQSRRRGVKFSEQFISASGRSGCPKDPRNWSRAITDRHDIPRDAGVPQCRAEATTFDRRFSSHWKTPCRPMLRLDRSVRSR